ncbi:hypothetical protein V6N12_022380 [Hibiscus sabdariffa]|uniref:Pentatricopeptide repeat-containing protein n=1 Tax=Hibiscus sabdariffa TaxID=183260 RepID=A0ABR2FUI4_9ROSI
MEDAQDLFDKMPEKDVERRSVEPDDITYIGVLNACGHAGLVKEGRAGEIDKRFFFFEETPIEANDVTWSSLLSACKKHNNNDVAEPVAKQSHWTQVKTSIQYNI